MSYSDGKGNAYLMGLRRMFVWTTDMIVCDSVYIASIMIINTRANLLSIIIMSGGV